MLKKKKPLFKEEHKFLVRVTYLLFLCVCATFAIGALFVIETKETAFDLALLNGDAHTVASHLNAFPIGVNPVTQTITEDPEVDTYFRVELGGSLEQPKISWLERNIFAKLTRYNWYQNLASPISRILIIYPGQRKEEVVDAFGDILRWSKAERDTFATLVTKEYPEVADGTFFPGRYIVEKNASPEVVAEKVSAAFKSGIALRYTPPIEEVLSLEDALIVASLLEREAYSFEDMRYISGIIWNRVFAKMPLQLDASLQYAKAERGGTEWWPVPVPADKFITSPFNTYKHEGLPPSPIANPSAEAILATLNPKETECLFYFHEKNGNFHCTNTYEEHVALLKQIYGRGK